MVNEVWKGIRGYKNYQVSNLGRVRNIKSNRLLIPKKSRRYLRVGLSKNNIVKQFFVHRLVYEAFYGKIPFWMEINHKDETPSNNQLSNLMLCNHKTNINWGTCLKRKGEKLKIKLKNRKDLSKPVLQFDSEGNFIKEYSSIREVKRQLGFNNGYISQVCLGKHKTAYGYIWKYKQT